MYYILYNKAVRRSENLRGHTLSTMVGIMVGIGLTDLAKTGGHLPPLPPTPIATDFFTIQSN